MRTGTCHPYTRTAPCRPGRVWNYAKTPRRGVQELEVYLDEQLVWKVGGHRKGAATEAAAAAAAQTPNSLLVSVE